jgi:antitoxin CcdA
MPRHARTESAKRPTNVTLSEELVDEARRLGVNLSQACERGLREQVSETRAAKWRRENAAALDASNTYTENNGLPLAKFRLF